MTWLFILLSITTIVAVVHGRTYPDILDAIERDSTPWRAGLPSGVHFDRELEGLGYHRTLLTQLLWEKNETDYTAHLDQCQMLLREELPSTLYFDLYQLDELTRFHSNRDKDSFLASLLPSQSNEQVIQAFSKTDIELERSAEVSTNYTVWFYLPHPTWDQLESSNSENFFVINIRVPIHARYQAARMDSTYATARIEPPTIYVRCQETNSPHPLHTTSRDLGSGRDWSQLVLKQELLETVEISVPVGSLGDLTTVRVGTFLVAMSSAVILCLMAWFKQIDPAQSVTEAQRKRK